MTYKTSSEQRHNGFKIYSKSTKFSEEMTKKIVNNATKRLEKSGIKEFIGDDNCCKEVELLTHSQLSIGECLGSGSFSSVYEVKAIWSRNKQYNAKKLVVKVLQPHLIARPTILCACAADIVKEGMIMAKLNHRNILSAQAWAPNGVSAYSNGRHDAFFLILDRLEETLSRRLSRWQHESSKLNGFSLVSKSGKKAALLQERLDVIMDLSSAVKYLHENRILHRDLKPDNIGFDRDGVLKVFDFDVARIVPKGASPDETFKMTKRIGSPRYMSPECGRGEEYNLKADVYTFGLLAYQIISLQKPYDEFPSRQHRELVYEQGLRPTIPTSLPKGFQTLLQQCWAHDVSDRPTMNDVHEDLAVQLPLMVSENNKQPTSSKATKWSLRKNKAQRQGEKTAETQTYRTAILGTHSCTEQ